MDIAYTVKQLDHEVAHLETQIREKRTLRDKLWSVLSVQEQVLFNAPAPKPKAEEPKKKPAT